MKNIEKTFRITKEQKETIDKMSKKTLKQYKSAIIRLQNA